MTKAIATGDYAMNIGGEEIAGKKGDVLEGRAAVAAVNAGKAKFAPIDKAGK